MGQTGIYKGREVLFLLSEPDEITGIGFVRTQSSSLIMKLRVEEVPELCVGDEIIFGDITYNIMSEPRKSITGHIWEAECCLV